METPKPRELSVPEQQLLAYFRALEQGETQFFDEWKSEGAQLSLELELDGEPPVPAAPLVPAGRE